ncbi:P-loop containing nucleoside triphosphate hydrolase protein, partial [Mycena galericulata]
CPPPSRIFHGRQDILDKMYHFFTSNIGTQHIYVLHGLGGAGKTQIALKFVNESSSRFSNIFFIDTSTSATIETVLKNIAVMKHSGDSQQDGLLWLTSQVEEWLLVFDNADDPSINLHDFIPQCNHGNVIITSRNPGLRVYAAESHSHVAEMEEDDAAALLLKSAAQATTVGTKQIATEIVQALHYLPLAIVQAGAYISKSQDLDSYLTLYTKNQAWLLSDKPAQSHDQYAWTVYTTWQMSFNQLKPLAATFLQLCSFLYHQGISQEIFSYASKYRYSGLFKEELKEPLEFLSQFLGPTGEWDSLQFLHVTNEVQAYSLISFDAEKKLFSIHPLVHAWSQ